MFGLDSRRDLCTREPMVTRQTQTTPAQQRTSARGTQSTASAGGQQGVSMVTEGYLAFTATSPPPELTRTANKWTKQKGPPTVGLDSWTPQLSHVCPVGDVGLSVPGSTKAEFPGPLKPQPAVLPARVPQSGSQALTVATLEPQKPGPTDARTGTHKRPPVPGGEGHPAKRASAH